MDDGDRKTIQKTKKLAEENNRMIKKLYKHMKWASAVRLFYWIIIALISVGAYYYVQPLVEKVLGVFDETKDKVETVTDTVDAIKNFGNIGE